MPERTPPIRISKKSEVLLKFTTILIKLAAFINIGNKIVPNIFLAPYSIPNTQKLITKRIDDKVKTINDIESNISTDIGIALKYNNEIQAKCTIDIKKNFQKPY